MQAAHLHQFYETFITRVPQIRHTQRFPGEVTDKNLVRIFRKWELIYTSLYIEIQTPFADAKPTPIFLPMHNILYCQLCIHRSIDVKI